VSLFLLVSLPAASWGRLGIWMAVGVALYFAYGRRRAAIAQASA
jgi:APA family basic amino acid/polyamine antiporter